MAEQSPDYAALPTCEYCAPDQRCAVCIVKGLASVFPPASTTNAQPTNGEKP